VEAAPGLRVRPLSGWEVAKHFTDPVPGVRLTRGNGNVDALASPFGGEALALANTYVENFLKPGAKQLKVSQQVQRVTAAGQEALRGFYVGVYGDRSTAVEGEFTVLVTPGGNGIVFDGWATQGLLSYVLSDIHTMEAEAEAR